METSPLLNGIFGACLCLILLIGGSGILLHFLNKSSQETPPIQDFDEEEDEDEPKEEE